MVVVADSSPLIYLSRVGVLDLLATLFDDIVVPRAVWTEVVQRRPSASGVEYLLKATWIRVVDSQLPTVNLGPIPARPKPFFLLKPFPPICC